MKGFLRGSWFRRSLRRFTNRPVPGETLRRVLRTALQSPSGGNLQPWNGFVVVSGLTLGNLKAAFGSSSALTTPGAQRLRDYLAAGDASREESPAARETCGARQRPWLVGRPQRARSRLSALGTLDAPQLARKEQPVL